MKNDGSFNPMEIDQDIATLIVKDFCKLHNVDLYPDIPYIGDCNNLVVYDFNLIGLHDYKTPIFHIEGNYTSNINYTLSSNSDIVSIKENKFKLTDYGIAEIIVQYDLGFYKGVRVFTVECKER